MTLGVYAATGKPFLGQPVSSPRQGHVPSFEQNIHTDLDRLRRVAAGADIALPDLDGS